MNNYYPMLVKLENKKCVVIGGGKVAERKVTLLLEAGANIELISPVITENLKKFSDCGKIKYINRKYKKGDLKGAYLVISATNSSDINKSVYEESRERGIRINIVDNPELCDFIVPSVIKRGPLVITVSTDGKSPLLAKKIKKEIEKIYGEEYGRFTSLLGTIRDKLQTKIEEEEKRKIFWEKLMEYNIPELLKEGRDKEVEEIINSVMRDA